MSTTTTTKPSHRFPTTIRPTILPPSRRNRRRAESDPDVEEDEPWPTYEVEGEENQRKKAQVEAKKRARRVWSQEEELILAKSFIQIFEDPKVGSDQKNDTFWYKVLEAYNAEAKKRGYMERTKNMLTGKWTPMNANVQKFNQIVGETLVHSGENDDD
ncbi:hypothetical protein Tco_0352248 [Tanacetum coccineum]